MERESGAAVGDDIASQTKRGAIWQLAGKTFGFALSFAGGIVLARLLEPDDFGLWALAFFCMKFARQAASAGLLQSVVQKQKLEPGTRDAAFCIALFAGVVLWGAVCLLAPSLAALWSNEQLAGCVRILAVTIPLSALLAIPQALLQRSMKFGTLAIVGLISSFAELTCSITLAALHYGVYSLLLGTVAGAVVSTVAICVASRYWPGRPSLTGVSGLVRFAVPVTASYLVRLIATDADYIIIAKRLSVASVGLYRRAYSSTTTAVATIVFPLQDVLFPAFSRLQAEDERLRYAFSRALCGLGVVISPVIALLFVVAPEYIPLVYGTKWQASVAPTQILCLAMVFMVIAEPSSALLKSIGRAGTEATCQVAYMVLLCIGAWIGVRWGISGVACGVAIAVCVNGCLCCLLASRAISLSSAALWLTLRSPLVGACVTLAAASITREALLAWHMNLWLVLGGTATGGILAYGLAVLCLPFPEGREVLRAMIRECFNKRYAQPAQTG